jgi:hypothetical protein
MYNIHADLNLITQKISHLGQIIVDRIKSGEYIPSDIDMSFDYEDTYGYLYIHATMSDDTNCAFYLISDWTNDSFSLPYANTADSNRDNVKVYSG